MVGWLPARQARRQAAWQGWFRVKLVTNMMIIKIIVMFMVITFITIIKVMIINIIIIKVMNYSQRRPSRQVLSCCTAGIPAAPQSPPPK